MRTYTVYAHINKANGKKYIGITSMEPEKRWNNGNGYSKNQYFTRAIRQYGWDGFTHKIIHDGLKKKEAENLEIELISKHKTTDSDYGYNIRPGGDSSTHSEESRKKMSRNHADVSGENNPMHGVLFSYEHRRKIGEKSKGRYFSEEARKKISDAGKGRIHSEDTRNKLSKALSGVNAPWYGKKLTDEHKQKIKEGNTGVKRSAETRKRMSEAQKGKIVSQETREKLSGAMKGKPSPRKGAKASEETKRKLSQSRKGKCVGEENSLSRKVININTRTTFCSVNEASQYCGINFAGISRCCSGKQKTAGKHPETGELMKWMYYDDYIKLINEEKDA